MRPPQRGELVVFCHQLLIRRHASILRRALVTRLETAQAVHVRIGAGIFWLRRGSTRSGGGARRGSIVTGGIGWICKTLAADAGAKLRRPPRTTRDRIVCGETSPKSYPKRPLSSYAARGPTKTASPPLRCITCVTDGNTSS